MKPRAASLVLAAALQACGNEVGIFETTLTVRNAAGDQPGAFVVGEPLTLTVISRNTTPSTQTFQWCSPQMGPVVRIYDANDDLVWSVHDGMVFAGVLVWDQYGPREERVVRIEWRQDANDGHPDTQGPQVAPGAYHARAEGCAFQGDERIDGFNTPPADFVIR